MKTDSRFFQVRRTKAADASLIGAQTAIYGGVQPRNITNTILFALNFVANYYQFVREHHPDFKGK